MCEAKVKTGPHHAVVAPFPSRSLRCVCSLAARGRVKSNLRTECVQSPVSPEALFQAAVCPSYSYFQRGAPKISKEWHWPLATTLSISVRHRRRRYHRLCVCLFTIMLTYYCMDLTTKGGRAAGRQAKPKRSSQVSLNNQQRSRLTTIGSKDSL